MKNKLALVIAVLLGLIAVYGIHRFLGKVEQKAVETNKTVRVVTAAQWLKPGKPVTMEMLSSKEISELAVTSDNIDPRQAERLIGQLITRPGGVERGEPLLMSYFRKPVEKLNQRLQSGERAVTLKVDAVNGVAGNIAPGSRVDIIATLPAMLEGGAGARAAYADRTVPFLSNVLIIAIDNRTHEQETSYGGMQTYSTVTVAATPQEANLLVFMQQYGTLTLALRPSADGGNPPMQPEINEKNVLELAAQAQRVREQTVMQRGLIQPAEAR